MQFVRQRAAWCFENPRRGLITIGVLVAIVVVIVPSVLAWILGRVLLAISPLITFLIVMAIVVTAFRHMLPKRSHRRSSDK